MIAVQNLTQKGGIDESLRLMNLGRRFNGDHFEPQTSHHTRELICAIKKRQVESVPSIERRKLEAKLNQQELGFQLDRLRNGNLSLM
jgi:hypothetical protein